MWKLNVPMPTCMVLNGGNGDLVLLHSQVHVNMCHSGCIANGRCSRYSMSTGYSMSTLQHEHIMGTA